MPYYKGGKKYSELSPEERLRYQLTRRVSLPETDPRYINPARRECLMCNDTFDSEHPWNRVCANCKSSAEWKSQIA